MPSAMTSDTASASSASAEGNQKKVTLDNGLNDDNNDNYEDSNDEALRRRFVSRHRKTLDFIKEDSAEDRRHAVPSPSHRSSSLLASSSADDFISWNAFRQVETYLPAWSWLKNYQPSTSLAADFLAGLTVGVMIVPQSMSYAKLAGLPVEYGLYSALVPVFGYALFGTSRQLAVGPVALISLLLSTGLSLVLEQTAPHLQVGSPEYITRYAQLAVQTSFLVGILNIAMGCLRLGFCTIFLSHAVISGFTTGAAAIIGLSQLQYLLGYSVERSDRLHELLQSIFAGIDQFQVKPFVFGTCAIGLLVLAKKLAGRYPKLKFLRALGPLAVTAVSIVLVVLLDLQDRGIDIVGNIPQGLPKLTIAQWTPLEGKLMVMVISIVIVGFMESIAIAKTLASKHKYEIDSSTELIGLGMSNFLGSMFNAYPVTGSFSRSAVNNESGATSGISAIVTATMVGFVLLFMTAVFEKMPLCVLASIVISGVIGLLDYEEALYLWKVHRFDFAVWCVACFGTMFLGVEIGLAIAVGVSLLIVLYESAYPHTSVMGRLPGTTVYRNVKQYPEAERYDGIVLMRIDAPLYFANAQNVRDKIRKYRLGAEAELEDRNPGAMVKYLILDLSPVSHLDTSALHILEDMNTNYRSRGQQLLFSNPSLKVMQRLNSSGLAERVGTQHFFASMHDAVHWCLQEMDNEATSIHESQHGAPVEDRDLEAAA